VFHSVGYRRENSGSLLKTVLVRVQPVTWPVLKLSSIGFSFSPSSTRCFTALAPIPALHATQWGPEILSAARSSQADDFGEQGKGRVFSIFSSVLVQGMWVGYWDLPPTHTPSQILPWLCLSAYSWPVIVILASELPFHALQQLAAVSEHVLFFWCLQHLFISSRTAGEERGNLQGTCNCCCQSGSMLRLPGEQSSAWLHSSSPRL